MHVKKIGFDKGPLPLLCEHEFIAGPGGELLHVVDGKLRASVPPEGFEGYAAEWPDCRPVVKVLRGAHASAKASRGR